MGIDVGTNTGTVLVLVSDAEVRDEVRRAAAAAGLDVLADLRIWRQAGLVVLDAESAGWCVADRLPRRSGVVLVTSETPALPDWQVATAVGAEHVLTLPADTGELVAVFGSSARGGESGSAGTVLAVIGGRGGAGASVFAAAVAMHGAQIGFRPQTLLVDGDRYGAGLDLLLGIERQPGLRWPALVLDHGRVPAAALHAALPQAGPRLSVLSCHATEANFTGPSRAGIAAVVAAGRAGGDLVVCDVPREQTPAAEAMLDAADLIAVVVPADLRSTLATCAMTGWVRQRNPHVGLVIRGPAPGGLTATALAAAAQLPVLATMRAQPRLAEQVERGGLRLGGRRAPLRRAAAHVLARFADRPDPVGPSAHGGDLSGSPRTVGISDPGTERACA